MSLKVVAAAVSFCLVAAVAAPQPAEAQRASIMRSQSRAIERAVNRNVERAFRPRLVVREGATGPVTAMALGGDERFLVTGVGNDTVRVWDLHIGREVARLPGHSGDILHVAVDAAGKVAASLGADGAVRVWNLKDFSEFGRFDPGGPGFAFVAFSPAGRLVAASAEGKVAAWDLAKKSRAGTFGAPSGLVAVLPLAGQSMVFVAADGTVAVHDVLTGQQERRFDAGLRPRAAALSGGQLALGDGDGRLAVLDLASGSRVAEGRVAESGVRALAYDAASRRAVAADSGGKLHLFDVAAGSAREIGAHEQDIGFVAVDREASFALSASADGTTRLWSLTNPGQALLTLISTEAGWAVLDDKGRYDGSDPAVTGIDWQDASTAVPIDNFAETHYEPALLPRTVEGATLRDVSRIVDGVAYPPQVEISTVPAGATATVDVVAEDRGGGVAEVRLYRNNRLVGGAAQTGSRSEEGADGQQRTVVSYAVPLEPGQNTLSAVALNDQRLISPQVSVAVQAPDAPGGGAFHVLTIGINDYADPSADLAYAKPDALSISRFFEDGKAAVSGPKVRKLIDGGATKQAILEQIRAFRAASVRDTLVIYLAGHGVSDDERWVFLPAGAWNPADPLAALAAGITSDELKREIEALPVGRILLLIDACQSGGAVSPLTDYQGIKALRLLAGGVGLHALAATDRSQGAVELDALGHGVFTYTLLQGLAGGAARPGDAKVTARQLIRYVEDQVPAISRKHASYDQFPTGYSRGDDFALAVTKR